MLPITSVATGSIVAFTSKVPLIEIPREESVVPSLTLIAASRFIPMLIDMPDTSAVASDIFW